jgi:hypothetical protein
MPLPQSAEIGGKGCAQPMVRNLLGETMKKRLFGLAVLAAATAWSALAAQDPRLPPCEPGYTYVPTTEYKEVESYVCKLVPYTKKTKKWVYTYKDAPFCIHKSKSGLLCLFDDPRCLGPFQRKLLVKKEIVVKEEQATRCVAEKVVTKVPCTVLRKVPVEAAPEKLAPPLRPLTPLPLSK